MYFSTYYLKTSPTRQALQKAFSTNFSDYFNVILAATVAEVKH